MTHFDAKQRAREWLDVVDPDDYTENLATSLAALLDAVRDDALEEAIEDLQIWCKHNSPHFYDQVLVMQTAIEHIRALKSKGEGK